MAAIGRLYAMGRGTTQDYLQALAWLIKAAEMGDLAAMHDVAYFYENGLGVSRNQREALKWHRMAIDAETTQPGQA